MLRLRDLVVVLCVLSSWGCGVEVEPDADAHFEEFFVDGRPPLTAGKSDEFTIRWQRVEGFDVAAHLLEVETRRVVTSEAAFERFFGVTAPESVNFERDWVVFYTPGQEQNGARADLESLRYAESMNSLRITTRATTGDESCADDGTASGPDAIVATFARPAIRPQAVRYYHVTLEEPCPTACLATLQEQFEAATEDLWYPSESDYLFDFVHFPRLSDLASITPELLAQAAGISELEPFEERDLDRFFAWIARADSDDMDDWERSEAARFRELRHLIETHLEGARIFRLADIEVQVFILGISPCGNIAGLKTVSVET